MFWECSCPEFLIPGDSQGEGQIGVCSQRGVCTCGWDWSDPGPPILPLHTLLGEGTFLFVRDHCSGLNCSHRLLTWMLVSPEGGIT